jgi:hypothetical protein
MPLLLHTGSGHQPSGASEEDDPATSCAMPRADAAFGAGSTTFEVSNTATTTIAPWLGAAAEIPQRTAQPPPAARSVKSSSP